MRIGKPKSGGKEQFKMVDGNNVYRILPPLGELAEKGIWSKYHVVCWGYKGTAGTMRPFADASEKNRKNGQYEVMTAALKRRTELELKQKQMKDAGATPDQMKKINEVMMQFNLGKKYYVNAVSLDGQVGVLPVGYKAYKALTGDRKTEDPGLLKKLGKLDPTFNLEGAYVNFHRAGKGFDTQYTVTAYQEDQGDGSFRIKSHTIDEEYYANKIKNIEESLNLLNLFPTPTVAEIEEIVNGGPEAVDKILGKPADKPVDNSVAEQAVEARTEAVADDNAVLFNTPNPIASLGATSTLDTTTTIAKEEPAPVIQTKAAPVIPPKDPSAMDPDEFLKSMGVDKV